MRNAYVYDRYQYSVTTLTFKAHLSHMLRKSAHGIKVSILKAKYVEKHGNSWDTSKVFIAQTSNIAKNCIGLW